MDCEMCCQAPRVDGSTMCAGCQEWLEYWNSLTPEEQRLEDKMMAEYVEETTDGSA